MIRLKKLIEDKNIKTIRIFITNNDYIRYNRKTPTYLNLLNRAEHIKPNEWTEYFKVSHSLFGKIKSLFKIEEK